MIRQRATHVYDIATNKWRYGKPCVKNQEGLWAELQISKVVTQLEMVRNEFAGDFLMSSRKAKGEDSKELRCLAQSRKTETPSCSHTRERSSLASIWWLRFLPMGLPLGTAWKNHMVLPSCEPTTCRDRHWVRVHCRARQQAKAGTEACWPLALQTGCRDLEYHLSDGKGTGAGVGGGEVLTRYT